MSRRRFSSRAVQMALFLAFIALIATIMHAYAAYRVSVPIVENDGHIRQDYLYGEGAAIHKGVDYPVATGTTVHAIADGVAVQVLESIPNGCHTTPYDPRCPGQYFGNFVLVRHNQRHWDKTTGQWAYVYSIYAHLSQDSVVVAQGDPVIAGQSIAQSDDTGNSSG